MVIEPIFEKDFAAQSYGFRPGRGCKDGLRRVDADLISYFDTITHERVMDLVEQKISAGKVLELIRSFLTQG